MGHRHPSAAGAAAGPQHGRLLPVPVVGRLLWRLAVLGTPLLVLFGEHDQRRRPSSAAAYRAVPGASVEVVRGVGHSPMVEDPPRTAARLQVFVASVLSGR